jgi:ubiquinone biosynthesis protein COQ9
MWKKVGGAVVRAEHQIHVSGSASKYLQSAARGNGRRCFAAAADQESTGGDPRTQILEAALEHVNTRGWSVEAIAAGAQTCGFPSVSHGMFPRGAVELVDFFMLKGNGHLSDRLFDISDPSMDEIGKIRAAIKERLLYITPYVQRWPEAMALGALPHNTASTLSNLVVMADLVAMHAGDRSTDINWYTKRALVTSVYATTEVYMLTDKSEDFEDTWFVHTTTITHCRCTAH